MLENVDTKGGYLPFRNTTDRTTMTSLSSSWFSSKILPCKNFVSLVLRYRIVT